MRNKTNIVGFIFFPVIALFLSGCSASSEANKSKLTYTVYQCDDNKYAKVAYFNQNTQGERIELVLSPHIVNAQALTYRLTHVEAASGVKYSDGIYSWWQKNDRAMFTADGVKIADNCQVKS